MPNSQHAQALATRHEADAWGRFTQHWLKCHACQGDILACSRGFCPQGTAHIRAWRKAEGMRRAACK